MSDTPQPIDPQHAAEVRKPNGQFGPGHRKAGNPGRKAGKSRAEQIADALWRQLSPQKLRKLAAAIVDEACTGNGESARAARTELLNRLAGRPGSASMQSALDALRKDLDNLKAARSATPAPKGIE